jgi:hypothetical protein
VQAPHGLGAEIGRLFVDEERQADALGADPVEIAQQPRELDDGGRAAGIVVGAGRTDDAVVMGADHDHLGIGALPCRLDGDIDVAHRFAVGQKFLAADGKAERCERGLDIAGDLLELVVVGDVVLARGDRRDVALERSGERRFLRRERRQRAPMRLAGHGRHVVQRPVAGGRQREHDENRE